MANDISSNGMHLLFPLSGGALKKFGISTATAAIVAVAAEDFIFAFAFSFILHGYSFALVFAFSWFYTSSLPLAIFLRSYGVGFTNIVSVFVSWDGVNFIVFTFHVNKVAKTTIQPIWVIFSQWIVLCLCPVVYVDIGRYTVYIVHCRWNITYKQFILTFTIRLNRRIGR